MMTRLLFFYGLLCFWAGYSYADEVIWSGDVKSDGSATASIPLILHERYQIKASQFVNLGKWVQAGEKLANDACYEFNKTQSQEKLEFLKNSQNISVCDGSYHPDHAYQSEPFVAKQNRIHFWVYDTDYDDNNGVFHVEIIHKDHEE